MSRLQPRRERQGAGRICKCLARSQSGERARTHLLGGYRTVPFDDELCARLVRPERGPRARCNAVMPHCQHSTRASARACIGPIANTLIAICRQDSCSLLCACTALVTCPPVSFTSCVRLTAGKLRHREGSASIGRSVAAASTLLTQFRGARSSRYGDAGRLCRHCRCSLAAGAPARLTSPRAAAPRRRHAMFDSETMYHDHGAGLLATECANASATVSRSMSERAVLAWPAPTPVRHASARARAPTCLVAL